MNKKILIGVLSLLLIGGGVFLLKFKKPVSKTIETKQKTTTGVNVNTNKEETIQGTIKSLLTSGRAIKCTFSDKNETASTEGTVYVAGGKVRGEIKTVSDKTTVNTNMLVDSNYSYVWTDASGAQGIKMVLPKTTSSPSEKSQTQNIDQIYNYRCQSWTQDNSKFELPTNIKFSLFIVPTVGPTSAIDNSQSQCNICNNIPDETARQTCKTQLNCQ